jgi:hypothetical protein
MKYKALFLDVDGTIIPYNVSFTKALPSKKVTEAIKKASEKLTVCLATGRPYSYLSHVLNHLDLEGYAIINDGAQVIDIATRKVLYEKLMRKKDIIQICSILNSHQVSFFLNDNETEIPYTKDYIPNKPYNLFVSFSYPEKKMDEVMQDLTHLPTIKVNKGHSGVLDRFGLVISHAEATKLHGVYDVCKRLNIKTKDNYGVGDSGNDFPLLMASGFKVAMGNAIPALKDIADYVAPTVGDDGVVDVIEKFILSKTYIP